MFGFSLTKLLFTAAVIYLIWQGFKWLGRVQAREKEIARERMREEARRMKAGGPARGGGPGVEEMIECRTCGAYVALEGARNCGRADCPYPG